MQLFHCLLEIGQGRSVLVSQGPCIFLTRLLNVPAVGGRDYAQTLALRVHFTPLAVIDDVLFTDRA